MKRALLTSRRSLGEASSHGARCGRSVESSRRGHGRALVSALFERQPPSPRREVSLAACGERNRGHGFSALFAALALVTSLAGCSEAPPIDDEAYVEIGTGTFRFQPVQDGDGVALAHGAQGGWHLWVSLRVFGVDANEGSVEIVHYPADEARPTSRPGHGVQLDPPDAEGGRAYLGWPAILRDPACAVGELYRIEVVYRPASGGRYTAERDVMVLAGDFPPPPCMPDAADLDSEHE